MFAAFSFEQASSDTVTLTYSLLASLLIVAFIMGFFVGCRTSNVRVTGSVGISDSPSMGGLSRLVAKKVVRKLEVKCKCGAIHKFSAGTGALPRGYEPMPSGDTYICPNCGNANDLTQVRALLKDSV